MAGGTMVSGAIEKQGSGDNGVEFQMKDHVEHHSALSGANVNISTQGFMGDTSSNPNVYYDGKGHGTGFELTYTRGGVGDSKNMQHGFIDVVATLKPIPIHVNKCTA